MQGKSAITVRNYPLQSWSLGRLQATVQGLVDLQTLPLGVYLFIDGLDELKGDDDQNNRQY